MSERCGDVTLTGESTGLVGFRSGTKFQKMISLGNLSFHLFGLLQPQ